MHSLSQLGYYFSKSNGLARREKEMKNLSNVYKNSNLTLK